ncbi:hypothetical protein EVAR_80339_1 [Eumeta japonica]|uniref:Uncharacterized protein n=1 Tax=Eumeta variegata TaxID=151549 RepID=A0A4C1X2N5_EUMVA|nr:hypothetical protein EVAR_80339_1 [Eumeta japonica]
MKPLGPRLGRHTKPPVQAIVTPLMVTAVISPQILSAPAWNMSEISGSPLIDRHPTLPFIRLFPSPNILFNPRGRQRAGDSLRMQISMYGGDYLCPSGSCALLPFENAI